VTSGESTRAAVQLVVDRFGHLDSLVNVSGVTGPGPTADVDEHDWDRLVDVHLGGSLRTSQAAFPALRASDRAAVVHVASVAARLGLPQRASYCAAKAGIEGLCRTLAVEWAQYGIRVNAIAPGYVRTDPVGRMIERGFVDEEALTARIPMSRLARPEEIATVIAFLISPDASYVTGETIFIDGGLMVSGVF
jgi:NAD(P)-dependent dehydrogenase (short-subunit alcohol dehydrogenase family)